MALGYRPVDRDQSFLLPPDMRDWLPDDHLVWFVLDVIGQLDTSALHARSRRGGVGREGYAPEMLLGLWVYASARGICSSRQIERACREDVAFRVLCAQDVPDHTVLARFRQAHQGVMADLFSQVLALCVRAGLGRFGQVAIDGTKIRANASRGRTVSLARLRRIAAGEFARAESADAAEDAAGDGDDGEVPPSMTGPGRQGRIRAAIAELEAQIHQENRAPIVKAEADLARARGRLVQAEEAQAVRIARYRQAREAGTPRAGRAPTEHSKPVRRARQTVAWREGLLAGLEVKKTAQLAGSPTQGRGFARRNTTDPDSRVMKTRNGFIQGFNAQLAVTDDHLIAVAELTNDPTDGAWFVPMMDSTVQTVAVLNEKTSRDLAIGTITADNGYLSKTAVDAAGPNRLIAPGRGRVDPEKGWAGTVRNAASEATVTMRAKLADPVNHATYKRRSATVETVNAHLKDRRGLRQFARRGLEAAQAELHMAAMTTNLLRLFTLSQAATTS